MAQDQHERQIQLARDFGPAPTLAELQQRLVTFHKAATFIRVEGKKIADDIQRATEGDHPDLHMIKHIMGHMDLDLCEVDWCLRRLLGKP